MREELIARQQEELIELSTPVVQLWDGILALPLIGTLDSERTQVVMESLLERLVETGVEHRDHRHHRRADRRHAGRPASAEDRRRRAADGRRLHHQRHPAADRADHRAPRRRPVDGRHQGDARGRLRAWRCKRRGPSRSTRAATRGEADAVDRIPILKIGQFLLVTIQVDMHDQLALALQDDLTEQNRRHARPGVLIDISALEIVDSFIGRMLGNIAAMSRILDAQTVVVGMRPAVAITLVELGLSLPGVRTALNVDAGLALLRKRSGVRTNASMASRSRNVPGPHRRGRSQGAAGRPQPRDGGSASAWSSRPRS